MILNGQRKCPPDLVGKLQSTPGIHTLVNNDLWEVPSKQRVVGSNPSRDASKSDFCLTICLTLVIFYLILTLF